MRRALAAGCTLIALASPAGATEWLVCSAEGGKASFSVLAGSLGIGTATDFTLQVGGKSWSTKPGEGTPVSKLQAFEDDRTILVTLADADMANTVAELRLYKATEGDASVQGGVLSVKGEGAWAVSCPNE